MKNTGNESTLPQHIAVIMDGNGRWAAKRGLPRNFGHRQGARRVGEIARHCQTIGVKTLTLYAFSTENWQRPPEEVDGIMNLLRSYLDEAERYRDENVRTIVLGDVTTLDPDLRQKIERVERLSADRTGMTLNIALNYGGREEIVRAAKSLASRAVRGEIRPEEIDESVFASSLYTAGQSDPDLVIRPSGELRLSNFLLWQCAYSEFVFMDILWPDFTPADLDAAIAQYAKRSRRFGGI